jgi:glucose-6-phosphate-specific signal transduction histidine kinase
VLVLTRERIAEGDPTVTVSWSAAAVIAWAVHWGWRGGAVAATAVGAATVAERWGASQATVNSLVLLMLVGTVVGYVVTLARRAEKAYAQRYAVEKGIAD